MLSNIAMTLPYKKLIQGGTGHEQKFRDTDTANGVEVKQGSFGF